MELLNDTRGLRLSYSNDHINKAGDGVASTIARNGMPAKADHLFRFNNQILFPTTTKQKADKRVGISMTKRDFWTASTKETLMTDFVYPMSMWGK